MGLVGEKKSDSVRTGPRRMRLCGEHCERRSDRESGNHNHEHTELTMTLWHASTELRLEGLTAVATEAAALTSEKAGYMGVAGLGLDLDSSG